MQLGLPKFTFKGILLLVLLGYPAGYFFLSDRSAERGRNNSGEVMCHVRTLDRDWQARMFRPMGWLEAWLIRQMPEKFAKQSERQAALPQELRLQGPTRQYLYLPPKKPKDD